MSCATGKGLEAPMKDEGHNDLGQHERPGREYANGTFN